MTENKDTEKGLGPFKVGDLVIVRPQGSLGPYDRLYVGKIERVTPKRYTVTEEGLDGAQWVDGLFTITRATGLNFPMNASDERVYTNP